MRPPTRWMPTTSSESSKPSLNFSSIARAHTAPATRPSTIAQPGVERRTRRGDRDETGDGTGGGTDRGGLAVLDLLDDEPCEQCGGRRDERVDERDRGGAVGGELGARVEAEPAEPQQAGAEEHERRVVRNVRALLESDALAEDEREGQSRGTGVDVDRGSTGEVDQPGAEDDSCRPWVSQPPYGEGADPR